MPEDSVLTEEQPDGSLPAPKPASAHVNRGGDVLPRPHEERSDAGIMHPSHRAE